MNHGLRPNRALTARWVPWQGAGLQHVDLRPESGGIRVEGVAIGTFEGRDFGARFLIECDAGWRTRRLAIETTDARGLDISSDGDGRWRDATGGPLPAFDGCIDVDLAGSPFTNTLPIRRLGLTQGDAADMMMVWVPFDSFQPIVDGQRYTCLAPRRFRYEATDGSFTAEIDIDDDGLVIDYPPLFRRA